MPYLLHGPAEAGHYGYEQDPAYTRIGTAIGRRTWNGSALISASAASSTDTGQASSVITNGNSVLS